ncbi:MAG: AAA family ATPase [Paludibacterium sp.]|uniref:AAA family ATPase n=1 Tax=Paludibacterium sp. TaxID=1917523 RepID=UPI0025EAE914|nr:AAA family ATPase [Paludibacterium sp.]MBV8047734.1 AAA family ATPase [Paludibacterium sp.]
MALVIDGHIMKATQVSAVANMLGLRYQIPRDDASVAAWHELARDNRWRPVTVTIGVDGVGQVASEVDDFHLLSTTGLMTWISIVFVACIGLMMAAIRTDLLRQDASSYAGKAPYSLERTQLVFLYFAALAGYLYLWLLTGVTQPLNIDALILLGIMATTVVVNTLLEPRTLVVGSLGSFADRSFRQRRLVSHGFLSDIVSDADGVSLVHVLVVGWTLVLTLVLGWAVYSELAIPSISVGLLGATGLINSLYLVMRSGLARKRYAFATLPSSPTVDAEEERDFALPPPVVPDELVKAMRDSQCVLYAGAGVSANANLPTWRPFVKGVVAWARKEQLIEATFAASLEQSIARGSIDRAADGVVSALIASGSLDVLHRYLGTIFGATRELVPIHYLIGRLPFCAVLTTNFDNLIDRSFPRSFPGATRIPSDLDALRTDFSAGRFFVLKLYGDLQRPNSLLVSPAQYVERIRGDQPFLDFVEQLFKSRSLLFLGSSVAGIEAYLAPLGIRPPGRATHFALVAVTDDGWRTDADLLERRYGIRVLPYRASPGHGEVTAFLGELDKRIKASRESVPEQVVLSGDEARDAAAIVLERIELHNIGPFEHLELPFTRRWTVLLGDNGVGKSSVLRAIASVVAGDVAKTEGGRLLRTGQTEGLIELTSRGRRYAARVALDSLGRPGALAEGAALLGGSILVLSFPAIRTMAAGSGDRPQLKEFDVPPNAADVLPALESLPDPRILGFKQWLINLDYARRRNASLAPRVIAILESLTTKLGKLLGRTQPVAIDIDDSNVFIHTDDGRLPLDALSQGTVSLLGWIGVVVQRMSEVPKSSNGGALVIIDEIDAHMHPEWQQAIVERLSDAFPTVQFIVSSHSPFLAVGRRAGEIVRFRRDPQTLQVRAEPTDYDTRDMTVADVLTSYLFGLQTPVDPKLERGVLRRRQLSVQQKLNEAEREELDSLNRRLGHVGIAAAQADPLYGRFLQEMSRQTIDALSALPPLSPEAEAEQRLLTERMVRQVLWESNTDSEESPP